MVRQRLFVSFAFLSIFSTGAHAQWLNFPTPGTPRTAGGKPNLTAPAPRAADGKPDLSGVWMHELTSAEEIKHLYAPSSMPKSKSRFRAWRSVPSTSTRSISCSTSSRENRPCGRTPRNCCSGARPTRILRTSATASPGFPLAGLLSEPIKNHPGTPRDGDLSQSRQLASPGLH